MQIEIKNKKVLLSLLAHKYDPNLVRLIDDVAIAFESKFQIGIIVTEGWRPGSGVHSTSPCRGLDLRSWIYTTEELEYIEKTINTLWTYDHGRPDMRCLIVHDVGKGQHIHLQVHPQSLRKD